jgi:hypothetical protein
MSNGHCVRFLYEAIRLGWPGPMTTTEGNVRVAGLEKFWVHVVPVFAVLLDGWSGDSLDDSLRIYS